MVVHELGFELRHWVVDIGPFEGCTLITCVSRVIFAVFDLNESPMAEYIFSDNIGPMTVHKSGVRTPEGVVGGDS